jgi:hypothetical protein
MISAGHLRPAPLFTNPENPRRGGCQRKSVAKSFLSRNRKTAAVVGFTPYNKKTSFRAVLPSYFSLFQQQTLLRLLLSARLQSEKVNTGGHGPAIVDCLLASSMCFHRQKAGKYDAARKAQLLK